MTISKQYKVPHRRAYDFFNLLASLGVCTSTERTRMHWCGVSQITPSLAEAYTQFEPGPCNPHPTSLFGMSSSPTLGFLAHRFIFLYLYHGFDVLSIRQAMRIFRTPSIDGKSLERRLYLVLSFLAVLGLVSHAEKLGEYRLMLDRTDIVRPAMNAKMGQVTRGYDNTVAELLNRPARSILDQIYQFRKAAFSAVVHE
jgi:hypothetical protein